MSTEDNIPQGRLRRLAPVAGATAKTAGEGIVVALRRHATGHEDPAFAARTAERYAEALGRSKGALMKAGQMLSFVSMGPAVPPEFQAAWQTALARLRTDAPPMAPELALRVVEAELRRPVAEAFETFDPQPLAAASIGQVHDARLHDGRRVAVKVQYPGADDAIRADLRNHELLQTFLGLLFGLSPVRVRMDTKGVAAEITARITEELDYLHEAGNQRDFADRYRGHPFIHVPEVVDDLSTARVLTQEFVDGREWDDALTCDQGLRDRWGEALCRFAYGAQSRFCMSHADPHPGNYHFHDDGSISVMDFGCVHRPTRAELDQTYAMLSAMLREDVNATWRASVEAGFFPSTGITPAEVYRYWRDGSEMYWAQQPFTVTPEHAAAVIERQYSAIGPSGHAFRQSTAPGRFTMLSRLDIGITSMLGALRATCRYDTMLAETVDGARAVTEMGLAEEAFFGVAADA